MATTRNRFRIISGQWRGRVLPFPDGEGLRPTGDRVRETLFNWLQQDMAGARCLDAFAGSGALGVEALSRGASQVLCLDTAAAAVRQLRDNAQALGTDKLQVRQLSAMDMLRRRDQPPFDLIFLDPPFALELQAPALALIAEQGWLSAAGKVYLESPQPLESMDLPEGWALLRSKRAGHVYFGLAAASAAKH